MVWAANAISRFLLLNFPLPYSWFPEVEPAKCSSTRQALSQLDLCRRKSQPDRYSIPPPSLVSFWSKEGDCPLSHVVPYLRDEKVGLIFVEEFWPQTVGHPLEESTALPRVRDRTLDIRDSGSDWALVLRGMAQPLISKVSEF